jgi:hypothetical protein
MKLIPKGRQAPEFGSAATECPNSPSNPPNGEFQNCNNKALQETCTSTCTFGGSGPVATCTTEGYSTVGTACPLRRFTLKCCSQPCALLPTLLLLNNTPELDEMVCQTVTLPNAWCGTPPLQAQSVPTVRNGIHSLPRCTTSQWLSACLLCAAYLQLHHQHALVTPALST